MTDKFITPWKLLPALTMFPISITEKKSQKFDISHCLLTHSY